MFVFIMMIVLILLASLAASLRAAYTAATAKELKRRAHKGDQAAAELYRVARHGLTADLLLLAVSIAASSLAFIIIAGAFHPVVAVGLIAGFIFLIFSVLPRRPLKPTRELALRVSPYLARLLIKLRPLSSQVARIVRWRWPVSIHTGLYDKEDLLELLQHQKVVPHNRIEATELELAAHVLTFGDKKVCDHMVPKHAVHFVHSEDPIGPVLLSELYDSGFSRFPVRNDEEAIVGTLYLKDLVEKRVSGIVSNVMSPAVFYINESESLEQVLAAFIRTKHHLFIAANDSEKMVGIISIEDVMEQMLGRKLTE